jgi:ribonuclease P protein component
VSLGFPKSVRLRKRPEFLKVQDTGLKVSADCLLALALKNGTATTRLGLTVSSKVGNAVVRNRIRRRLREAFRARPALFPKGLDVVLVARASAAQADTARLVKSLERAGAELSVRFPSV